MGGGGRNLSHVGEAAVAVLKQKHASYHNKLWASTSGSIAGDVGHGPRGTWETEEDLPDGHSDWLPETLAGLLAKTETWCDFVSLSPPDGRFMETTKETLLKLYEKSKGSDKKIVVRFLFGNIIAAPTNCDAVMKELTEGIPTDSNLVIWVGAWRKGMCWNHAKIVAVDGKHLFTGGHNLWEDVYLQKDPIHDTSIHLTGDIAVQAHLFCNTQWEFIREKQSSLKGWIVDKIHDGLRLPIVTRVTVTEWPDNKANTFAPIFEKEMIPTNSTDADKTHTTVPIISLGRYGNIVKNARSSDDAFIAMFDAAQNSIRFFVQDFGPVNKTVAGRKAVYKDWPKIYFNALSRAIYERGVDVEITLSNPTSGEERGNYSNGWTCEEVAAEIIKCMRDQYGDATPATLKEKVVKNLRICFIRNKRGDEWQSNNKVGLHSKFFIVDDVCTYVGSQNLYMFDLAEFGVAIDDKESTETIKASLWTPMWNASYLDGRDCNPDKVLEILDVDRDPHDSVSDEELAALELDVSIKKLKASSLHT